MQQQQIATTTSTATPRYQLPQTVNAQMSAKLLYGDIAGPEEALHTLVRGLQAEIEETRTWNASLDANDPEEARYRWDETVFAPYLAADKQALSLWSEEQRAMQERVLARLRALNTDDATRIADALEAEAWDALAW